MKKMKLLSIVAAFAGLFMLATTASAINLPTYMEFDLDNWTRLFSTDPILDPNTGEIIGYTPGAVVPAGAPASLGDMSRAFVTLSKML